MTTRLYVVAFFKQIVPSSNLRIHERRIFLTPQI